jgi:hypothetical protein
MVTPLSISDVEAEALLAGADGDRAELADLAEVLTAIRAAGAADAGRDFSHLIAPAALESRATPMSRFAEGQAVGSVRAKAYRLAPRIAVGAAALFMLIVGTSGLAYAANGSKPGDWLYGLDRAAEVIGIGDGGDAERVAEAQDLAAAGVPGGGLTHAAAVLGDTPAAVNAVNAAAIRLHEGPPGAPAEVAEKVAALLNYIHYSTITGTVDVEKVSDLARQIGGPQGDGAPGQENDATPGNSENAPDQEGGAPGNSENTTGQNEEDPPGNSEDAPGQNEEDPPGNSENAPGQDEGEEGATEDGPGQSDDAPGPPEDAPGQNEDPPGPPEDAPGQNEDPPGPPVTTPGRSTPGGTTTP